MTLIGIDSLNDFFTDNTTQLKETTSEAVLATGNIAVEDSILALDRKSQESLEKISGHIAHSVADFLYERDADLLFLATLSREENTYTNFMRSKTRLIAREQDGNYRYDDTSSTWQRQSPVDKEIIGKRADLEDNSREFNRVELVNYEMQSLPLYKEITFFDLNGIEQAKVSSLNTEKLDISKQDNTYIKAETYFTAVEKLEKGEIYVSDVIGAYIPSRIIGNFNKEKAKKAGIPFAPEEHGYAGRENPVGKRFEGIIRFVTPVFEDNKKVGYVSLALDHRHIMAFTDTVDPLSYSPVDVSDASAGNYAFMWDYEGRAISHARDYFIVGFDPETGQRATPWLSAEVVKAFEASQQTNINDFLKEYPKFDEQSLNKKPSPTSIKNGSLGLDCRYLNFAPQCQGWMQLTEKGGLGSFIIYWSNVWKLSTAATIPYYTGQYGNSARGFGFITLGANVEEFHKAAYQIKKNLDTLLGIQLDNIEQVVDKAETRTNNEIDVLVKKLTSSTLIMVLLMIVIAAWLSNLLRCRLQDLIVGAKQFTENNLSYRIPLTSKDEIGILSDSFNNMASSLQEHIQKEKDLNLSLEHRITERTEQLTILNSQIQKELTEKEKKEKQLKVYARVFSNTTEAIIIFDANGIIEHVNQAFTKITGYPREDVIGHDYHMLTSLQHSPEFYQGIWDTVLLKKSWEGELWTSKRDGTLYPVLMIVVPILDKKKNIINIACILHDMSEKKKHEQQLHQQAYYDPLTKLANRTLAYDRLEHAIANAQSNKNKVAVLFLDLDKFKQVNDTMGHDIGDVLLCEVGERLLRVCEDTDTVSRLGGDEFLIILEGIIHYEYVIHVVEKIIGALNEPFIINEQLIHTSTSVGITFYPEDGSTVRRLLKNSDIAMYRAKAKGVGEYEVFTKDLGLQVQEKVLLEHQLKEAVINKEFLMHYQPIINLTNQEMVGFEALMRWQKEDKLLYPDRFMDCLEHTKLIIEATEGVILDIFTFTNMVNCRYDKAFYVTVNISAIHFALNDFCDRLIKLVKQSDLKASLICLEVTETIFLHDIEVISRKLCELREFGFKIALDDFGTGYSSLSYLKMLPLDKIKIDRTFVKELPGSTEDAAITASVCSWGENFNLEVVAEGVETLDQLAFLKKSGCSNVQGYLFAKPMNESALLEYIDENL